MSISDYNRPPKREADPEPVIKIDVSVRNDNALEKLLDEYFKRLDKIEEVE